LKQKRRFFAVKFDKRRIEIEMIIRKNDFVERKLDGEYRSQAKSSRIVDWRRLGTKTFLKLCFFVFVKKITGGARC
jgi:hypothetical protein